MAEEPPSSITVTAPLSDGHIFRIRDAILADSAAVQQWSQIKDELARTIMERSLIDRELKEGDTSRAVLRTLQSWRSHEGNRATLAKLCDVLKKYWLEPLAENLAQIDLNASPESHSPLWFGMTDVVTNFVGRETEVHEVHKLLNGHGAGAPRMGLIHGEQGVGKTELARKYAHDYRAFYNDNVIWIEANCLENVLTALRDLIRQCQCSQQGVRLPKWSRAAAAAYTVEAIHQHLDCILETVVRFPVQKYLIILNDYQIPTAKFNLIEYLSNQSNLSVLVTITSQSSVSVSVEEFGLLSDQVVQGLHLKELRPCESMQMILDALSPANSFELDACEQIATRLGHLPFALHQAITFIKDSKSSAAPKEYGDSLIYAYLQKLQSIEAKLDNESCDHGDG